MEIEDVIVPSREDKIALYKLALERIRNWEDSFICVAIANADKILFNRRFSISTTTDYAHTFRRQLPELYKYRPHSRGTRTGWWPYLGTAKRIQVLTEIIAELEGETPTTAV